MKPHAPIPHSLLYRPFTFAEGEQAGLSRGRLRAYDIQHPYHGVRDANPEPLSFLRRCDALAARLPSDAFFSSLTAARLHGAPLSREHEASTLLHVARPVPAQAVTGRGVIGHRVKLMGDDIRLPHGLRASSPVRTWCELGEVLTVSDLVAVGDFLTYRKRRLTTIEQLTVGVAAYPGRRGLQTLRAALPLLTNRAESRRESLFRVFLHACGFTGFEANFPVTLFGYDHRIDIAMPAQMVAFEYQGEGHFTVAERRKDMTRRSRLEASGWHVMEISIDDLRDPVELEARIRAFLALWP
jgi:very-short-patch-repair endonuclease